MSRIIDFGFPLCTIVLLTWFRHVVSLLADRIDRHAVVNDTHVEKPVAVKKCRVGCPSFLNTARFVAWTLAKLEAWAVFFTDLLSIPERCSTAWLRTLVLQKFPLSFLNSGLLSVWVNERNWNVVFYLFYQLVAFNFGSSFFLSFFFKFSNFETLKCLLWRFSSCGEKGGWKLSEAWLLQAKRGTVWQSPAFLLNVTEVLHSYALLGSNTPWHSARPLEHARSLSEDLYLCSWVFLSHDTWLSFWSCIVFQWRLFLFSVFFVCCMQ